MTFDQRVNEIKSLYEHYDKSDKTLKWTDVGTLPQWEIDFLLSINAIKFTDYQKGFCSIVNDYPMLVVYKNGVPEPAKDFDGNIYVMEDKIAELKQNKSDGKIKYFCRNYPAYKKSLKKDEQPDSPIDYNN